MTKTARAATPNVPNDNEPISKRQRTQDDGTSEANDAVAADGTALFDLPPEVLELVFSHLQGLEYFKLKILMSHPIVGRYLMRRCIMLKNFRGEPTYFKPLSNVVVPNELACASSEGANGSGEGKENHNDNDEGSSNSDDSSSEYYSSKNMHYPRFGKHYTRRGEGDYSRTQENAIESIESFQKEQRVKLNELTVYFEFKPSTTQWKGKSSLSAFIRYCDSKGISLIILDSIGVGIEKYLKGLKDVKFDLVQHISRHDHEYSSVILTKAPKCTYTWFKYPETAWIAYKATQQIDDLLRLKGVVWNYTIENLNTLKFLHTAPKLLTKAMAFPMFHHVKKLMIIRNGSRNKSSPREIIGFNMPNLTHMNIINCVVSQFRDNRFENLQVLAIEGGFEGIGLDESVPENASLRFRDNYLPKLKTLDISVSSLAEFTSDTPMTNLQTFRLDTDFKGMYGTMEFLFNCFCSVGHLSFIPRTRDHTPEMMELLISGLYDCSNLNSLLIADNTDDKWLMELTKKEFPNLRDFYFYNAKQSIRVMPQLRAPQLKNLTLLNTKVERVEVREYLGPICITFTSAEICFPRAYWRVHFFGDRYLKGDCCNGQYAREWVHPWKDDLQDNLALSRDLRSVTLAKGDPCKYGHVDLRYHECKKFSETPKSDDLYLVEYNNSSYATHW